jgi:hypothetical protein
VSADSRGTARSTPALLPGVARRCTDAGPPGRVLRWHRLHRMVHTVAVDPRQGRSTPCSQSSRSSCGAAPWPATRRRQQGLRRQRAWRASPVVIVRRRLGECRYSPARVVAFAGTRAVRHPRAVARRQIPGGAVAVCIARRWQRRRVELGRRICGAPFVALGLLDRGREAAEPRRHVALRRDVLHAVPVDERCTRPSWSPKLMCSRTPPRSS